MKIDKLPDLYGSNFVPGEGLVPCDLLLIGEAPGKNEDREGRPFVGSAGKLLDRLLLEADRPRASVRITNSVKQRPPENRTPLFEEIQAHRPFLLKEIEECKPFCILALGKTAMLSLFDKEQLPSIAILRRSLLYQGRVRIFSTYHPAAALRVPSYEELILQDLNKCLKFIHLKKKV
jgi:DNA polymerase